MTPPTRPPPPRPRRDRQADGPIGFRGCAWLAIVAGLTAFWVAFVLLLGTIATPRSAPDPTTTPPVVDVRPGSAGPSAPVTGASGPELSGAPQATAILGGYATWYADPTQPVDGLYAAAGPALRDALGDWRGREVRVQVARRWTTVVLRDACWCVDRHGRPTLLDVSPAAIAWLEPEYRQLGIVEVKVAWATSGPLPATDTNGGKP